MGTKLLYSNTHSTSMRAWVLHYVQCTHITSNAHWSILDLPSNLSKVHQMKAKWPWNLSRAKVPICILHTPPEAQIYCPFHSAMCHFWVTALFCEKCTYRPIFGISAVNVPNVTLTCSSTQVPICILYECPDVHSVRTLMRSLRVVTQFGETCTEWPQQDIDIFKVKDTHMHTSTYIAEAHIIIHFALGLAVLDEIGILLCFPIGYNVKIKLLIALC